MAVRIQLRHDTVHNWNTVNPILLQGEIGIETDGHRRFKVGNGKQSWTELNYFDNEFLHTFGDETVKGDKTFENNITIESNLTVQGEIDGTAFRAIADENNNNISNYYQRKLSNENTIVLEDTDWDELCTEGVYEVNIPGYSWGATNELHQPCTFDNNINRQGLLLVHAYSNNNMIHIYFPSGKSSASNVTTVVYRNYFYNNQTGIGYWTDWQPFTAGDKTVVHLNEDEEISGSKTFTNITNFTEEVNISNGTKGIVLNDKQTFKLDENNKLYMSGQAICIRPQGMESDENQINIGLDGVITGKCVYDKAGNDIDETYIKKTELGANIISTILKEPQYTKAELDQETYNQLVDRKHELQISDEDIFEFINNPFTIYAYACNVLDPETGEVKEEKVIYADSDVTPTVLVDKYNQPYEGTDFVLTEGVITYGEYTCLYKEEYNVEYGLKVDKLGNVTGFGPNNYLKLKQPINLNDDFEITFEFTTPEEMPTEGVVVGQDEDGNDIIEERLTKVYSIAQGEDNQNIVVLSIERNGMFGHNIGDGTQWLCTDGKQYGSVKVLPNTHYIVTINRVNNLYTSKIKTDSEDAVIDWTFESDVSIPEYNMVLGISRSKDNNWFIDGSINIKSFSIKVVDEELIKRFETETDIIKDNDYTVVNDELILYGYSCESMGEDIIYADSDTTPTKLYGIYKNEISLYDGDSYRIDKEDVEGVITYSIKYIYDGINEETGELEEIIDTCALVADSMLTISPTLIISEDNIARRFSVNSYIVKENLNLTDDYQIVVPFKTHQIGCIQEILRLESADGDEILRLDYCANSDIMGTAGKQISYCQYMPTKYKKDDYVYIRITKLANNINVDITSEYGNWHNAMSFDVESYYEFETYEEYEANKDTMIIKPLDRLYLGVSNSGYRPLYGYIDLNLVTIFVNDEIVYNPCLSISYVYANNGTKITDVNNFQRLSNMIDAYQTANYFILDEEGEQFKLPYDSIYGYCRQLKQWRKGAESYEYDTNLECVQTGSTVAETPVVFKKPFADDNYYISVPYAEGSKTREGFTPTENGIYYAKGRVFLE